MSARLRFLWVVFAGGAVLMALEILSSRILAPRFGSSVYVWGSIISVFLAALAAGYAWGGRLADRDPTFAGLGRMVTWAAAAQALLLVFGTRLAELLGRWTGAAPWGTLLAATLLFAPPAVLLATLSPYAVRLAARDLEHLGHTAGRLYALSTVGSLVGTLGATFGLIPHLALESGLALVLGVTAATAVLALLGDRRRERASLAVAVLLLAAAFVGPPRLAGDERGLVHQRMTPHQTLRVVDEDGVRYLESDRVRHGAVRLADGEMALSYPRLYPLAWAYQPEVRRVLILGMGGGNSAAFLRRAFPGVEVDLVEIDPAVPEVARRFMGFAAGDGIEVHIDDGRRFLEQHDERWDLIVADTYIGLSVPFHMTTREFLAAVDGHLAAGGVFAVNLAAGLGEPFPRAIYRTLAERFETVDAFPVPGLSNTVLFASHGARPPAAELERRAAALDRRGGFRPPLADLARRRLPATVDVRGVPVLSDRFAPVDRLIHLDADDLPPALE
jgi:spermidine synthase